jgi:alkanesulfonate monooxygenase SsuD/methylene tetrahydromethanopterin reductase-like flavin-dependent oxidoreductase (luciferase family)
MTDNDTATKRALGSDMGPRSIAGSTDQIVDAIGQYTAHGFDELIVPDFTLGETAAERVDAFRRFQAEVAVQLT